MIIPATIWRIKIISIIANKLSIQNLTLTNRRSLPRRLSSLRKLIIPFEFLNVWSNIVNRQSSNLKQSFVGWFADLDIQLRSFLQLIPRNELDSLLIPSIATFPSYLQLHIRHQRCNSLGLLKFLLHLLTFITIHTIIKRG